MKVRACRASIKVHERVRLRRLNFGAQNVVALGTSTITAVATRLLSRPLHMHPLHIARTAVTPHASHLSMTLMSMFIIFVQIRQCPRAAREAHAHRCSVGCMSVYACNRATYISGFVFCQLIRDVISINAIHIFPASLQRATHTERVHTANVRLLDKIAIKNVPVQKSHQR